MAFWVVDGSRPLGSTGPGPFYVGGKRRVSHSDGTDGCDGLTHPKRARFGAEASAVVDDAGYGPTYGRDYGYGPAPLHGHHCCCSGPGSEPDYDRDLGYDSPPPDSVAVQNLSFLVIRERSPTPEPPTSACGMERTESGLSISSDQSQHEIVHLELEEDEVGLNLMGDLEAAHRVHAHVATFRRRCPDSQHERILKALINPKSRAADFPLDNDALESIFSAANELFFANRLAGRVAWDWSHPASVQYEEQIVGTTALRRSRNEREKGYETLIVLSSPILKDTKYNRRLLISTFLHEMIHSYLFITCGIKARRQGGHTEGFRQIAETIDNWVGREHLHLRDMEADLERFRDDIDIYDTRPGVVEDWRQIRGGSPRRRWDERVERDRNDYYLNEPSRRRHQPDHNDWHWYEREGFGAHSAHAGGSPYVD